MVLTGLIFIAGRPDRHLSGCAARGVDEARCLATAPAGAVGDLPTEQG
jgi:hypothetical protein